VIGAAAAAEWAAAARTAREAALSAIADRLDAASETLVALAGSETALGVGRLTGEVARTDFQLRMFATLLGEPDYLPTLVDDELADPPPQGRPELRRGLVPLEPVAFSVPAISSSCFRLLAAIRRPPLPRGVESW